MTCPSRILTVCGSVWYNSWEVSSQNEAVKNFDTGLQWVMIYSFGMNTDFENKSQFYTMAVNEPHLSQWTNLGINTELQVYLFIP